MKQRGYRGSAPTDTVGSSMVTIPKTLNRGSSVGEVRSFFLDDHVHMALIVAANRRLLTTIERADIADEVPDEAAAIDFGRLEGRTAPAWWSIGQATAKLSSQRLRRLAVVDGHGKLVGLVCLKRSGTGY